MAALSWSPPGVLRRPLSPLRGIFCGSFWPFCWQVPPPTRRAAGTPSFLIMARYQQPALFHQAGPAVAAEELDKDCCERRQAPRSDPAPVRSGTVDPPALTGWQPGDGMVSVSSQPPGKSCPVMLPMPRGSPVQRSRHAAPPSGPVPANAESMLRCSGTVRCARRPAVGANAPAPNSSPPWASSRRTRWNIHRSPGWPGVPVNRKSSGRPPADRPRIPNCGGC